MAREEVPEDPEIWGFRSVGADDKDVEDFGAWTLEHSDGPGPSLLPASPEQPCATSGHDVSQPELPKIPDVPAGMTTHGSSWPGTPGAHATPVYPKGIGSASPPPPLRVCSRRQQQPKASPETVEHDATDASPSIPLRHLLMEKITIPVSQLLPHPPVKKRQFKAHDVTLPRRSRRVAEAAPWSPGPIVSEAQKRVIKSLGFAAQNEKISQEAQDAYNKLFVNPASDAHMVALASIFGWTVDEGEEIKSVDLIAGF